MSEDIVARDRDREKRERERERDKRESGNRK